MSREDIPEWDNMPESVPISSLSWEDIYPYAYDELGREPTESEIREIFDTVEKRMSNSIGEYFSENLETIMGLEIEEMLKKAKYDASKMTDEQLNSKKFCPNCDKVQDTYWEVHKCDKNPEGVYETTEIMEEHGNVANGIVECSDEYCNPTDEVVDKPVTREYVSSHTVEEKCGSCHSFLESQYNATTIEML